MTKHTQTIRRQMAHKLFDCFDRFVGLALKGLNNNFVNFTQLKKTYCLHSFGITKVGSRPLQIACPVTTVHVTCTQEAYTKICARY